MIEPATYLGNDPPDNTSTQRRSRPDDLKARIASPLLHDVSLPHHRQRNETCYDAQDTSDEPQAKESLMLLPQETANRGKGRVVVLSVGDKRPFCG